MAFEAGRGRTRIPVVPALLAAVVAVVGVVATLTIDRAIGSALNHPELAGITWDASVTPVPSAQTGRNVTSEFAADLKAGAGSYAAAAVVDRDVINVGDVGAPAFSLRPITGASSTAIRFTLTSGRAPRGIGEAAIGPATARDLHVGIGDTITVGNESRRVRIVGESLFPDDVHAEFDEGLWIAPALFDAVVPPIPPSGSNPHGRVVAVQFPPGTSVRSAMGNLGKQLGPLAQDVSQPRPPDELTNLHNIRALPDVLAAFLGLMAVAALSSVIMSCARRRRRDFAVLRAMGMTRRSVRLVLTSQGTAIGLFGLAIGIPVGLAVGRIGWRAITEHVPLLDVEPVALVAMLLTVPVTIVVANLLAVWPGHVALSRFPAEELRSE